MNEEFINNIKEIKDKAMEPYKNIQKNKNFLSEMPFEFVNVYEGEKEEIFLSE